MGSFTHFISQACLLNVVSKQNTAPYRTSQSHCLIPSVYMVTAFTGTSTQSLEDNTVQAQPVSFLNTSLKIIQGKESHEGVIRTALR